MHTKAFIFDYGGTLDTRGNHWGKVIWKAYQEQGVPVSEEQFREAYVYAERTLGRNPIVRPSYTFKLTLDVKLRLQLEYLAGHLFDDSDSNAFKKLHQRLLFHLYEQVQQTVGESREVLSQLYGRFPMALVSNFYGNVHTVLQEMQLDSFFSPVIESAVVGIRKPDPQIFLLAVEALQEAYHAATGGQLLPQEITIVGDSMAKDIVPARTLGCQTVWFKGEGWTDKQEDESIPDHIITSLEEILQLGCLVV